jgi:tRNA (guanine37-N1)-methyltransferase
MKISILTLFPEMFTGPFDHSIIKNAKGKKIVDINFVNIRDFGIGKHKTVDDKPYGGGHGMILRVDVLEKAILHTKDNSLNKKEQKIILLDPHGKTFNQKRALELTKLKHLILICGHYEGVDERAKKLIDGKISIGDFITTGGEIPAMIVTDAVIRLLKGVLKEGVTSAESFPSLLEYPQYTKPNIYKNLSVPSILLSGDHKKIALWRAETSLKLTRKLRPDLLSN